MRKRLEFLALYGLSWVLFFQFFRVLFLVYHYKKTLELPSSLWVAVPGMDCKWIFLSLPTFWSFPHYYSFSQPVSGNGTGKTLSVYSLIISFSSRYVRY
jgi:hypothetical protein